MPPFAPTEPTAPTDKPLERGDTVGRFVVLGILGRGGMGEVYAARDPELHRNVAIKLLHGGVDSESPDGRMRLMREAQAIARVSHPNVVVVYDVGAHGKRVFVAMELVDGHTLRYWAHARPRTWPEVLEVFTAAGRGLAAAHERELVHRDFKPDNVMIASDGQVRVMDFGLVRLSGAEQDEAAPAFGESGPPPGRAEDDEDLMSTRAVGAVAAVNRAPAEPIGGALSLALTQTGATLGTPAYMAPEQFRNAPTDARTDQFSFCVALYETLYGDRPFAGGSLHEVATNVCNGRVREPPAEKDVPGWVRDVVLRGLRVDPNERWPSMTALLAELEKQPAVASRRRFAASAAAKLAGVWEPPRGSAAVDTPARAEMQRAFLSTGKAYAAAAYAGASRVLDAYARRWSELYVEACEATHVRGEQSADVLDLRMACLQEGLADLAALVRLFRAATPEVVENAVSAANALGTLERCENIELLRAVVRPPNDPATREGVDRLRRELADVRAFGRVGRIHQGLAAVAPLEQEARRLAYEPLLAEVLIAHSRLHEEHGAFDDATRITEEALMIALACRHEEVAAEAATQLVAHPVYGSGAMELRLGAAEIWSRMAEALLRRIGGHDLLWGWLFNNRSAIRGAQGRVEDALENARLAIVAKEKALGPDHPDVGISIGNVALHLDELGQLDAAIQEGSRCVRIVEAGLGPDHPRCAIFLTNQSEYLARGGRWDEATDVAARAVAIFEREAQADGMFLFAALTALGTAHLGAKRTDEALPLLERAARIGEAHAPTAAYLAQARFALARALWEGTDERDRALALATAARNDYAGSPPTLAVRRELGNVDAWLAERAPPASRESTR